MTNRRDEQAEEGGGLAHARRQTARWRRYAGTGDATAQLQLGMALASGHGVQKDSAEAAKWIEKAAEQGHTEAQFLLALAYRDGLGVERRVSTARRWLEAAAAAGHAEAARLAGELEKANRKA